MQAQYFEHGSGPTQLGGLFLGCVTQVKNRFSVLTSHDDCSCDHASLENEHHEFTCGMCEDDEECYQDENLEKGSGEDLGGDDLPYNSLKDEPDLNHSGLNGSIEESTCNDDEWEFPKPSRNKTKKVRFNKKIMSEEQRHIAHNIKMNMFKPRDPDTNKRNFMNKEGAQNDLRGTARDINAVPNAQAIGIGNHDPVGLAQLITDSLNQPASMQNLNALNGTPAVGGQWVPITLDSGAAENVVPNDLLRHIPTVETDRSQQAKRNGGYATASGQAMPNNGEQQVALMTKEGCKKGLRFQKTGVRKPLASVSRICEYGHRVVFERGNSYIEDGKTGEKLHLREVDGLFILDAFIPESSQDFTRHGI